MLKNDVRLIGVDLVTPYEMRSTSEMYRVPPPKMLIEGVMPVQSITGLTSYPGVGKTWFALEMARALACGDPFLGNLKIERPGTVLFVGSDASEFDYADQWRRLSRKTWAQYVPTEEEVADPEFVEPVNLLEQNVRFLVMSDFMFENLDSVRRLIKTANGFESGDPYWVPGEDGEGEEHQDSGFNLIVFDTLSKLTRANQNDNTEMEEVFRNIRLITESTGAAVLLLHHNSKRNEYNGGDDWRGAMAQIGALDGWLNVSKPYKKDKSRVKVEVKKFRGRQPKPFAYKMDVDGELDATLTACDIEEEKPREEARIMPAVETRVAEVAGTVPEFVRHLLSTRSMSSSQIQDEALMKFNDEPEDDVRHRVRSTLNKLKKKGDVVRDPKSKHYMLLKVLK